MRAVLFLIFSVLLGSAAPIFIPPNETFPLIDRGRIPLDISAISSLADDLATIANRPAAPSSAGLRNQAMLVALAQRLSPTQKIAREVRFGLISGNFTPSSNQTERNQARARCFKLSEWLLDQPNSATGQLLGQQLLDILLFLQPNHQLSAKHDQDGASLRWQGVISPLEKFGQPKTSPNNSQPKPKAAPPIPEPKKIIPPYQITEFEIKTPLISQNELLGNYPSLSPLKLKIQKNGRNRFQIKPDVQNKFADELHDQILEFFENQERPLSSGYQLQLSTGDYPYHWHNKENILAPLAIMLDSSLKGEPLRKNVLLFAKLQMDGSFSRPAKSWQLIQALRKLRPAPGTRIIVPPQLEEEMTGLLVQEDAAFLMRFEVISCRDISEAQELYLSNGDIPKSLSNSSAIFQEVVEKARPRMNDLNVFLAFESVKKRLATAVQSNPRHLSAKVLYRQASGNRPSKFSTTIFAMEYHSFMSTLIHK